MEQTDADERDYFLGSIVLTTSADPSRPWVVDGQQRLASITMIYAAMRDYCLTHGEPQIGTDIAADYLYNKDKWTKIESPRLVLSDEDTLFFTRQVLAVPGSAERSQAKRTTDSHRRIAKAFEKITKKVRSAFDQTKMRGGGVLCRKTSRIRTFGEFSGSLFNISIHMMTDLRFALRQLLKSFSGRKRK